MLNPEQERTTYSYDLAGRRTRKVLSNGTLASYTYDDADRLTVLRNETTGGTVISRYTYTYDKVDNPQSLAEVGSTVNWNYDAIYQLRNERRTGSNAFNTTCTYDDVGNRRVKNAAGALTTTTYDAANQIIRSVAAGGTTTFTYDAAGNLRSVLTPANQRTTHAWNDDNRQKAFQLPGGAITTYTYRWDGLRVAKVDATTTEKFIYDGQAYLLKTNAANVLQAVNTNEPDEFGNLVSQRQLIASTWIPVYHHYDHLGSTRQITSSAVVVANSYIYDAWGEPVLTSETIFNRFRWVGEFGYYHDSESDDYYVRARYYDVSTGRWLSQDPLFYPLTVTLPSHTYVYAANNPVNMFDLSGLAPKWYHCIQCIRKLSKIDASDQCNRKKMQEECFSCPDIEDVSECLNEVNKKTKECLQQLADGMPDCIRCSYKVK